MEAICKKTISFMKELKMRINFSSMKIYSLFIFYNYLCDI